jgi:tetratricopeptide (TPR) repeat protein
MTAGVVGLVKRFRYVLISPALLDHLSGEELKAVMAHEMGHVKKRHLVFYVVFLIGYLLLAYSFFDLVFLMLFSFDSTLDLLVSSKEEAGNALSLITTVPPLLFMFVYFRYLFGLFSRNFERQADLYALKLTGSPEGLINSLKTLTRLSGRSEDAPSWHHHSISERIRFLRRCEENPSLVAKHNRKVSTLVLSFLIVILGSAYFGYFLNRSTFGQSLGTNFAQKFLEKRAEKEPGNASVHFALANILFERKDFPGAEAAYRRTLSITPLNPDALNNLAWLYATCPDPRFKKPEEALRLAQVAVYLNTAPHILDTLAESYFINGKFDAAIEAIREAIKQNPENMEYYQEQLEKFMSAKRKDGGRSKGRGQRLDKALRITSREFRVKGMRSKIQDGDTGWEIQSAEQ